MPVINIRGLNWNGLCGDCITVDPPCGFCNNCTPALEKTYILTIAGLSGAYAVWNGTYTLSWEALCTWKNAGNDPTLFWDPDNNRWTVQCYPPLTYCNFNSGSPCSVEGSFPGTSDPGSTWTISAP